MRKGNLFLVCILSAVIPVCGSATPVEWSIVTPESYLEDAAIQLAVEDLNTAGKPLDISFILVNDASPLSAHTILVGSPTTNRLTAKLIEHEEIHLNTIGHEQGYEIQTIHTGQRKIIVIAGGSLMGDIYGLYWLWDRLRVYKEIPDINTHREPALSIRLTGGESREEIQSALHYSATWVSGRHILNMVPWDVEPEKSDNETYRKETRKLVQYAHSLHLKYLPYCDEMTFHPSLLRETGAELNPSDPRLWNALETKYRRLFQAMPELDGVRIRTGELTRVFGNYVAYDVMHDRKDSGWSLEKTYRTFVQTLHNIVVKEFDKIYFHRTWVTNTTEQHSQPDVYANIFTDDVPKKNLYLSPYLSKADRWFYQPYNPTFNQTPHNMVVLLSTLDYHTAGGVNVFPTFPGPYYQGGLRKIVSPPGSNVKGAHFTAPAQLGWDTANVTAYTAFRLAWNPQEDLQTIAEDFASIYFGRQAAPAMATLYLLSSQAYKDGLYIKPVAEAEDWNTLPQLRLTTFPVKGFPEIDKGRTHIDWLRSSIYKTCVGRMDETLSALDRGLEIAQRMKTIYRDASPFIEDQKLNQQIANAVELTYLLVRTNNLYVKTCFAYFDYRENPTQENKDYLTALSLSLQDVMRQFAATSGCVYKFLGITQLITAVNAALTDVKKAELTLANAIAPENVEREVQKLQAKHKNVLGAHTSEAIPFLHWEGFVDGKDILYVQGDQIHVEHIGHDPIQHIQYSFKRGLPQKKSNGSVEGS